MHDSNARKGELLLSKNAQATWRAGVVAAVVAGALVPMWLIAVDRWVPLQWGLFPPQDYRRIFWIGLACAAVATVVSLWVARMRQPRGARISWDAWGITEWDGDGARVAIPWNEATVAARLDTGGESLALTMLHRAHLGGWSPGDGVSVIGLTLRLRGAHGREIWVTDGVQTPALAGRLNTVDDIGPLIAAIKGVRIVPMGSGHPGENVLALFWIAAIGGYVCATLGLGVLITEHTVPTYVPHFLGGSAGCLAVRVLLPFFQHRRLGAQERKLRGARRVTLVANDGQLLTVEDETGKRRVVDTSALAHPDARLYERRGEAFAVIGATGDVVAVETAAVRGARRTYRRALAVELVLRALLVIPVLAVLALFHSRVTASEAWTVIAGPYSSYDMASSLLADGSYALLETHTSFNADLALFDLAADEPAQVDGLGLWQNNTVEALALAPGRTRAVISRGPETLVWEEGDREARPRGSLAATTGVVVAAFAPDGGLLLTGRADGSVSVWDTASFEPVHTFTAHEGEVLALAVAPDGALAVSGGSDGTARLLDLRGGTQGTELAGHDGRVQAVAFLGETVVTGAADGDLRFFSAAGALERTVAARQGGITAIGIHSGGAFATAGDDHVIRVWDRNWRDEDAEVGMIDMHVDEDVRNAGRITGLAFSSVRPDLFVLTAHGMLLSVDLTRFPGS